MDVASLDLSLASELIKGYLSKAQNQALSSVLPAPDCPGTLKKCSANMANQSRAHIPADSNQSNTFPTDFPGSHFGKRAL